MTTVARMGFGEFLGACRDAAQKGANVIDFPAPEPDESWLTQERIEAYYVALSFMPAIVDASPLARDAVIDKMLAGLRAARKLDDALDAKGREQCIALMRYDAEQRAIRIAKGGW